MKVPVHTVATRRHRLAAARRKAITSGSALAALDPDPPGSTKVSIGAPGPGSGAVPSSRPLSVRTGPPRTDATRTWYPPRLPSDAATSPAPTNTSCGPTTSIGCTPSNATKTTARSLTDPTLTVAYRWRQRHVPHRFGHSLAVAAVLSLPALRRPSARRPAVRRWPAGRDPGQAVPAGHAGRRLLWPSRGRCLRRGQGRRGRAARRVLARAGGGGWPGAAPRRQRRGPGTPSQDRR